MVFGDSKTAVGTWPATLQASIAPLAGEPVLVYKLATGGSTVAYWRANIDASLAGNLEAPKNILSDLGVNDNQLWPLDQTTWQNDYGYILDAFHTKWPLARVFVTLPWGRNAIADASYNAMASWIGNIVAARSAWAFIGDDERIWLKGSDDGVTNTVDGVHYSVPGNTAAAAQRQAVIGF